MEQLKLNMNVPELHIGVNVWQTPPLQHFITI